MKTVLRLLRAPLPAGRIPHLDGWRGVAIGGVLVDHFLTTRFINLGRFGVEMFFVLSGMLMANILFVKQTPLSSYFARRVSRTYPTLLLSVTVITLVVNTTGFDHIPLSAYLSAITATLNYYTVSVSTPEALAHVWSLCIEEHSYIFLAVVALGQRRFAIGPMLLIGGVALACLVNGVWQTLALHRDYYAVYWRTDVRASSILIGSLAFLLVHGRRPALPGWTPLALGLAAGLVNLNPVPDPVKYSIGTALLACCLCALPFSEGFVKRVLSHPLLVGVGQISYSLYLWQQPFALVAAPLARLSTLVIVLPLASLSTRVFERPVQAAINRRLGAAHGDPPASRALAP